MQKLRPEDLDPYFTRKETSSAVICDCDGVIYDLGYGNDLDASISRILVSKAICLQRDSTALTVSNGGFLAIGQTLILLGSSLSSISMGGESMSHIECVNSALVAQDLKPMSCSLEAASLRTQHSPSTVTIQGFIISEKSNLLKWQPSDTPCLATPASQQNRQQQQADWLTRRTDTGALAELFIWHYLQDKYENTLPLSSWVSGVKRRFHPLDRSRVNDALGADFEFVDSRGVFSSKRGSLIRAEVKGSVRSEVTQFEISRNELKGFNTSNSGGCEYVIILVCNVASELRPPSIYALIRDPGQISHLEPIQFLASFNMHQRQAERIEASGETVPSSSAKRARRESQPALTNSSWYTL